MSTQSTPVETPEAQPSTNKELEEAVQIITRFMTDLKTGLKKKYEGRSREGVHMSDLCPRQIVFRDLNPNIELTNTELNNFSSGAAIGAAIESTAEEYKDTYSTEQFTSIGHFINGHIDVYDKKLNIPIEFKSYRSGKTDKLPKWHQADQLKSYMVGQNAKYGILLYQLLMKFDNKQEIRVSMRKDSICVELDPFAAFLYIMTEEDRIAHRDRKIAIGLQQVRARAYGQPALAPHVQDNPELRSWLCAKCPFLEECNKLIKEAEL